MMDFHVLTPAGPKLLMRVVDGKLVIVPAPGMAPDAAPAQKEPENFTEIQL